MKNSIPPHNAYHPSDPHTGGSYYPLTPVSPVVVNPQHQYAPQNQFPNTYGFQNYHAYNYNPDQLVNLSSSSNRPQQPLVGNPSTSNQYTALGGHVQSQARPASSPQSISESQLYDKIYELKMKLCKSQATEQKLREQNEIMSRDLHNISQCLHSTTVTLRSEESLVRMQAREIEQLKTTNDQLNKMNTDLKAKAQNDPLESESKELKLKNHEEGMDRELQEISKRLDSTTIALKTEEHIVKLQAKKMEKLKKENEELNDKRIALKANAQNALLALDENSRLVQEQVRQIVDLKDKYYTVQKENEELKSKYQGVLRSTEQDTYSMEQFSNALQNMLINNDLILENLKGIQTDPEEKEKLMVGHNETHRLLREQEDMNMRARELEKQCSLEPTYY